MPVLLREEELIQDLHRLPILEAMIGVMTGALLQGKSPTTNHHHPLVKAIGSTMAVPPRGTRTE